MLPLQRVCRHRPIFPGRRQPSIFGTDELNFRVRNGNGWILIVIDTDSIYITSGFVRSDATIAHSDQFCKTIFEPIYTFLVSTWPTGHLVRLQGFEPGTHWLRVSCSTSWAKGAYLSTLSLFLKSLPPSVPQKPNNDFQQIILPIFQGQALGLLVSVSLTRYRAYTSDLSTG